MNLKTNQINEIVNLYFYLTPTDIKKYAGMAENVEDLIEFLETAEKTEEEAERLFRDPEKTAEEIFINFANAPFIDYIHHNITRILELYKKGFTSKNRANIEIVGIVEYLQEREDIEQTRAELLADYYACIM